MVKTLVFILNEIERLAGNRWLGAVAGNDPTDVLKRLLEIVPAALSRKKATVGNKGEQEMRLS